MRRKLYSSRKLYARHVLVQMWVYQSEEQKTQLLFKDECANKHRLLNENRSLKSVA